MRGQVTTEIKAKAKELLDIDSISVTALRLMPYMQYHLVNNTNLNPVNLNEKERRTLSVWRKRGFITGGASEFGVTKKFWDAMCELIWLGYVRDAASTDCR